MSKKYFFHNYTGEEFVGMWNGRQYRFKPGIKQEYPMLIARHFAKHLVNRELIKKGKYTATSPKKPNEVPEFMAEFDKAFFVEEVAEADDLSIRDKGPVDVEEPSMNIKIEPREPVSGPYDASAGNATGPGDKPQVLNDGAGTDDDDYEPTDKKAPVAPKTTPKKKGKSGKG